MMQLPLFEVNYQTNTAKKKQRTGTFVDNMKAPIHRWFRYSAGFSADWTNQLLKEILPDGQATVLDPFVGSGTTTLSADFCGHIGLGIEAHPFVARIATTKLMWNSSIECFTSFAKQVSQTARIKSLALGNTPGLLQRCFTEKTLSELFALKQVWKELSDNTPASELVWLAITAILRSTSTAGTAQWQYILPTKTKKNVLDTFVAFDNQIHQMVQDMRFFQSKVAHQSSKIIAGDARSCPEIPNKSIDLVITSPPYANNYDYADATRLEMTFWDEVESWGGLHNTVRNRLIVSSSQHASKDRLDLQTLLADNNLGPIIDELTSVCQRLSVVREEHGGKKHYHTMIAAYFRDMALTMNELRRVCKTGTKACFVIGDSAPYGVYVPVEKWIGNLAIAAGFDSWRFEKIRDRNTKWKNRKHTVPLHEGHLWIEG